MLFFHVVTVWPVEKHRKSLNDSLKFLDVFLKNNAMFLKVLEGILEDSSGVFGLG